MSESTGLYMVRLVLNAARLYRLAMERRLPLQHLDLGYLVHSATRELFGEHGPQPFAIVSEKGADIEVLGYAPAAKEELKRHADTFANPALHAVCRWESLSDKPFPTMWRPDMRMGFVSRVCPIQRMAKDGVNYKKGAEVDVFLAKCWETGDKSVPVVRDGVYREWLEKQFEKQGARLMEFRMTSFQRERVCRRTQGQERRASCPERPSAVVEGELIVTDPERLGRWWRGASAVIGHSGSGCSS